MVFLTTFSLFATAQPTIRDQNTKTYSIALLCAQANGIFHSQLARLGSVLPEPLQLPYMQLSLSTIMCICVIEQLDVAHDESIQSTIVKANIAGTISRGMSPGSDWVTDAKLTP